MELNAQIARLTKELNTQITKLTRELNTRLEISTDIGDIDATKYDKAEVIRRTWEMPELPIALYDELQRNGFQTGSTVYGNPETANDEDWGINIPPHIFSGYTVGTSNTGYFDADFTPLYAHHAGKLLNIMCFGNHNLFLARLGTTELMEVLKNIPSVSHTPSISRAFDTKWRRVRVFRALCDALMPVKALRDPLDKQCALDNRVCKVCGQEAINFTTKLEYDHYLETGICERCHSAE
jgi:hypothetical protein